MKKDYVIKNQDGEEALNLQQNTSQKDYFKETFFYVFYQEKKYKKSTWYSLTSDFSVFNEKEIKLKDRSLNLRASALKEIFLKNRKRHVFLGNILPCVVFLFISLVILTSLVFIQQSRNFSLINKIDKIRYPLWIISILMLGLSGVLYYLTFVKNQQIIYTKKRSRSGYKVIAFEEFEKMLKIFDQNIENEYLFFSPLVTERLKIRELKINDTLDFFSFAKNPNVTKYLMWKNHEKIEDSQDVILKALEEYKQEQIFRLGIAFKDTNKVIGYIGLSKYDLSLHSCQIVYAIGEEYWHQGYTKEAVNCFVDYLKKQGKTLIIAGHVEENINSGKVLLSCGFRRDANRDSKLMIHGEMKNIINYSIKTGKGE